MTSPPGRGAPASRPAPRDRASSAHQIAIKSGRGWLSAAGGYGLLWRVADRASPPHYFAGGYGGQYIMVIPDVDLVAVTMGDADTMARPPMGLMLRHLLYQKVVPAMIC